MAKGFKKRYFSLAAITATVSLVALSAQAASVEAIEKVVVSADKSEESVENVTDDVTVITAEEIEERGYRTLGEVLREVPGINVVSYGGYGKATSLFVRGMDNDKILILIDGVRYNDPSNTSGPSIEHLLLTNVKRIEIIKGAQSGIWGSDAASGVINIITSDAAKKRLYVEGGTFASKSLQATMTNVTDSQIVSLNYNFFKTKGFSAIVPYGENPKKYEADGYINRTAHLKYGLKRDKKSFDVGLHIINAKNEADGYNDFWQPDPNTKNDDTFKYHAFFTNLKFDLPSNLISLHIDTTQTKRAFLDAVNSWEVKDFVGKTTNIEARDKVSYAYGYVTIGAGFQEFKSEYIKADGATGDVSYSNSYGFFANKILIDRWIFSQNVRYDSYDKFDNQWTGKLGVKYNLNNLSFFANVGKAYNVPNQIKMLNPWGISNFNLQPEKTLSYDIGVQGYGVKVVVFKEKVKDLIDWQNWQFVNLSGTSTFKGVEVSYETAVGESLLMNVGYTFLLAQDAQDSELNRRARHKIDYSFTWYPTLKHTINVNGYFIGKRWDDKQKSKKTGSYNVVNVVASHQFAQHFKGYVKIDNLFDRRYQEVYGYGTSPRAFYIGIEATY